MMKSSVLIATSWRGACGRRCCNARGVGTLKTHGVLCDFHKSHYSEHASKMDEDSIEADKNAAVISCGCVEQESTIVQYPVGLRGTYAVHSVTIQSNVLSLSSLSSGCWDTGQQNHVRFLPKCVSHWQPCAACRAWWGASHARKALDARPPRNRLP